MNSLCFFFLMLCPLQHTDYVNDYEIHDTTFSRPSSEDWINFTYQLKEEIEDINLAYNERIIDVNWAVRPGNSDGHGYSATLRVWTRIWPGGIPADYDSCDYVNKDGDDGKDYTDGFGFSGLHVSYCPPVCEACRAYAKTEALNKIIDFEDDIDRWVPHTGNDQGMPWQYSEGFNLNWEYEHGASKIMSYEYDLHQIVDHVR
jgi:hypothetical protein